MSINNNQRIKAVWGPGPKRDRFLLQKLADAANDSTNTLKKLWQVWQKLCDESGFGWDNELKIPKASAEVWEPYLKVFTGTYSVGKHANAPTSSSPPPPPFSSTSATASGSGSGSTTKTTTPSPHSRSLSPNNDSHLDSVVKDAIRANDEADAAVATASAPSGLTAMGGTLPRK
ncbi:hypothetical protein DFS34DRAFT_590292 [Phlyctochytrium arcticum]|nr:hypothetical protein DFS34DRAFT_590292 [Phlyctochytrium arcticum]